MQGGFPPCRLRPGPWRRITMELWKLLRRRFTHAECIFSQKKEVVPYFVFSLILFRLSLYNTHPACFASQMHSNMYFSYTNCIRFAHAIAFAKLHIFVHLWGKACWVRITDCDGWRCAMLSICLHVIIGVISHHSKFFISWYSGVNDRVATTLSSASMHFGYVPYTLSYKSHVNHEPPSHYNVNKATAVEV